MSSKTALQIFYQLNGNTIIKENTAVNTIACYASMKQYPVINDAIIMKASLQDMQYTDVTWHDILKIIRRRYYENVILITDNKIQKRSIEDIDYFNKLIFKDNSVTKQIIDIIDIQLEIYYNETSSSSTPILGEDEINKTATRFLNKIIRGDAVIKFTSKRSHMTMRQFKRLDVLAYEYKNPWEYTKNTTFSTEIIDLPEYRLVHVINQWHSQKNICQECGITMNSFKSGKLYNKRCCSDACLTSMR